MEQYAKSTEGLPWRCYVNCSTKLTRQCADTPMEDARANADGLGRTSWPEGSIVVLEGYADETTTELSQLAIMEKRHGVWYWEQYQGDDFERPRFSGRPDVCLGCHNTGQDFTRSFPLPKLVEE